MILNISGRTDVVAFYTEWLRRRYKEGFVDVRNPFYPKQVSRIYFDDVDGLVFCTKNPIPILPYLREFKQPILFQITLTGYKKEIEPGVASKEKIIDAIKEISKIIGSQWVQVRYDPIFVNDVYTLDYHCRAFERLCQHLKGSTNQIIISFLDDYKNVRKNKSIINEVALSEEGLQYLAQSFTLSATKNGMTVQTCSEKRRLIEYGFINEDCVGKGLAEALTGKKKFKRWAARNNKYCHCVEMVDIGVYNSCGHYCRYCYANYDENQVESNRLNHYEDSTMLIGRLEEGDILKERKKRK